jgi:hypothetical protein
VLVSGASEDTRIRNLHNDVMPSVVPVGCATLQRGENALHGVDLLLLVLAIDRAIGTARGGEQGFAFLRPVRPGARIGLGTYRTMSITALR